MADTLRLCVVRPSRNRHFDDNDDGGTCVPVLVARCQHSRAGCHAMTSTVGACRVCFVCTHYVCYACVCAVIQIIPDLESEEEEDLTKQGA